MSINGFCHDFAFTRCNDRNRWLATPSALPDPSLWARIKSGFMGKVNPNQLSQLGTGVLTVVNPAKSGGSPAYCTHSYYVDSSTGFLLSSNDPFGPAVMAGGGALVPVAIGVQNVVVLAYTITDLVNVMSINYVAKTARIGADQRVFSFYWCDESVAKLAWWHA